MDYSVTNTIKRADMVSNVACTGNLQFIKMWKYQNATVHGVRAYYNYHPSTTSVVARENGLCCGCLAKLSEESLHNGLATNFMYRNIFLSLDF
jgi:hypothetical protein